jgi:cytochrome b subunit of formate dehydrogenase
MSRLIKAIRGIGWLIVALAGMSLIFNTLTDGQLILLAVGTAIVAGPFFLVAWIIDGFVAEHRAGR